MKLGELEVLAGAIALALLAAVGVYAWKKYDLGTKLNPASADNFAYSGASAAVTSALGRDESVGTAGYEAVHNNPVASAWRWFTGPSTDDIDYSGPVTPTEKQLVKNNFVTP